MVPVAVRVDRAIIVSDLHLRRSSGERTRLFLDFLARRLVPAPPDVLVIAGDLFDFCTSVGGRLPSACRPVVEALEALPRVIWLEGNHDFRLAGGLSTGSSIEVRPVDLALRWGGRSVYVQHGDLLTRKGRLTRLLLRSPLAAAGARLLGTEGAWLLGTAVGLSRSGLHAYDGRRSEWLETARAFAAAQRALGFDLSVLGHGHWLGRWDEMICLGDWPRWRSYLELAVDGGLRLRRYEPELSEDPLSEREPSPR